MRHSLSIIVAAIIFGSSGVFVKTAHLPVASLAFLRMVVFFVLMSLVFCSVCRMGGAKAEPIT